MKIKLAHIVSILLVMVCLHFVANATGLYETRIIWIDKVLHIMAGAAVAMLWIWFLQGKNVVIANLSSLLVVSSVVGTVALLAVSWEILEYIFWKGLPQYAETYNIYSPTIFDLLSDVAFNVIGGAIFTLYWKNKT